MTWLSVNALERTCGFPHAPALLRGNRPYQLYPTHHRSQLGGSGTQHWAPGPGLLHREHHLVSLTECSLLQWEQARAGDNQGSPAGSQPSWAPGMSYPGWDLAARVTQWLSPLSRLCSLSEMQGRIGLAGDT